MKTTLQRTSQFLALTSIVLVFFTSCIDEKYDINKASSQMQLTPGVAAPLAHTSFSAADLLKKLDSTSIINATKDGTLFIEYTDSIFSFNAADSLKIPNQLPQQYSVTNPVDLPFPGAQNSVTISKDFNFEFSFEKDSRFDSVLLKGGKLVVELTSGFPNTGNLSFTFPNVKKNAKGFSQVIPITSASGSFNTTKTYLLDQYTLSLDNTSVPNKVVLPINIKLQINKNGSETFIAAGKTATINIKLIDLNYSRAFGYIGTYDLLEQSSSIELSSFNNSMLNNIKLEKPEFTIIAHNSYGATVNLVLTNVSINSATKHNAVKFLNTTTNTITDPSLAIALNRPSIQEIGKTAETVITLNPTKTNLFDLINGDAYLLNYSFKGSTKAKGTGVSTDFVLDTSKINLIARFYSPLSFTTLGDLNRPDTIDVNFNDMSNSLDKINSVQMLLDVTNGFPLNITFTSIDVVDSQFGYLLTLFKNKTVSANALGNLNSNNLTKTDIDKLKLGKHILLHTSVSTPQTTPVTYVTLKNKDKLTLFFKIKAEAKIDL